MPQSYSGTPSNVTSESALAITAATNATPIAITTASPHRWSTGDQVVIANVAGNTAANSPLSVFDPKLHPWTITVTGSSTFTIDGSVGSGAYTSGGVAVNISLQPAFDEPLGGEAATTASILTAINALGDRSQYIEEQMQVVGPGAPMSYLAAINWAPTIIADVAAAAIDTIHARPDGTTPPFWSTAHNCWILMGSNTAGRFYYGDFNYWTAKASGGTPKLTFGVSGGTGLVMFSSTAVGAANVPYVLEGPLGTYTNQTMTTGAAVVAQSLDAIIIQNGANAGRIVVVGAVDTNYVAWTSDDNGATFTQHTVSALVAGSDPLTRVIEGPSGSLVAWVNIAAANGGNILYTSSDGGVTWAGTGAIGFDLIKGGVYVASEQQFVFIRASEIRVAAAGSSTFVAIATPGTNRAVACIGSNVALSVSYPTDTLQGTIETISVFRLMNKAIAWYRILHRNAPGSGTYNYIGTSAPQQQLCAVGFTSAGIVQLSGKV